MCCSLKLVHAGLLSVEGIFQWYNYDIDWMINDYRSYENQAFKLQKWSIIRGLIRAEH